MKKRYVTVNDRGTLTLPADVRHAFHLDDPGVQLEVVTRQDVIELRPHVAIPAGQAWFWTPSWQKGERAVDEHVAAGRVKRAENVDAFLAAVDKGRSKPKARK